MDNLPSAVEAIRHQFESMVGAMANDRVMQQALSASGVNLEALKPIQYQQENTQVAVLNNADMERAGKGAAQTI